VGTEVTEQLYRWHWRKRLPERHGQLFRVLVRGTLNSCLVEFIIDGWQCVTSRDALRSAQQSDQTPPRPSLPPVR
jgi:hypothetical protein